jgi:hypothetical protein
MNLQETLEAARLFLELYVKGSADPEVRAAFPDAGNVGIRLRRPAVLDERPDYELPGTSPFDEQLFNAGEGPENSDTPYIFSDRCPITSVATTVAGNVLNVEFLCICDFPADRFPIEMAVPISQLGGRRVLLPVAFGQHFGAAEECLDKLQDFLGEDASQIVVDHSVTLLSQEEFDERAG